MQIALFILFMAKEKRKQVEMEWNGDHFRGGDYRVRIDNSVVFPQQNFKAGHFSLKKITLTTLERS